MSELLSAITEYQRIYGIKDAQLARKLGISHAQFSLIKSGRRKIGIKTIKGAAKIPSLLGYCIYEIIKGDPQ